MGSFSTRSLILYLAVSCVYVPRKYLSVLGCSDSYLSRAIKSAIGKGFITKSVITERVRYRNVQEEFYQITGEGLHYLAKRKATLPEEIQWVGELFSWVKNFAWLKERPLKGSQQMRRYLSVSGTAVFCAAAGCCVPLVFPSNRVDSCELDIDLDDDDMAFFIGEAERRNAAEDTGNEKVTLTGELLRFIESEKGREQNPNGILMNRNSDLVFTNVFEMKRKLREALGQNGNYSGGRFTGVVEGPLKSVLLYEGKRKGMSWSKWITDLDLRTYRAYINRVSHDKNHQPGFESGAILVKNAKMFADLVLKKYGKKQRDEKFANGFSSFMFFPINAIGAQQFSSYLRIDLNAHYEKVISDAIESQAFKRNVGTYQWYFPLITMDGVRMMIGTFLDGVKIQKILDIQEIDPFPFGVICFAWQQDYFRRIFPNALFFTLS